jgi:hypothetical protein
MRVQGIFTAAKLLALVAVVIAGVVHIAGGENGFMCCEVVRDRLCGLVVRVPGFRTKMYCVSC